MLEPSARLRNAIISGNLPIAKRIIRRFPNLLVNYDPKNGWSSLHYAGYHGHYLVCVFLVQQGHDQEEISLDHRRNTPLHLAAMQNHEQTVHFLAQHIPRCLDWVNNDHETALMVAARKGNDPCINLLLDFGADIDIGNAPDQNRPVHIAAAYGHIKTLRTLVDRNADVQTPNQEGWRPVQYCSTYQVQDYLQSLIHEKSESAKKQTAFFQNRARTNENPTSNSPVASPTKTPSPRKVMDKPLPPPSPIPFNARLTREQRAQFQPQVVVAPQTNNNNNNLALQRGQALTTSQPLSSSLPTIAPLSIPPKSDVALFPPIPFKDNAAENPVTGSTAQQQYDNASPTKSQNSQASQSSSFQPRHGRTRSRVLDVSVNTIHGNNPPPNTTPSPEPQ